MSKHANRLGRGLSSLIGSSAASGPAPAVHPPHRGQSIVEIPIEQIRPNPNQPRTQFTEASLNELAQSLRDHGVIQPLIVRATSTGYELVAGERRWRAARLAGLPNVPAVVREVTDAQSFELALIENLQREDLGPLERAAAYQHYLDAFGGTVEQLAGRLAESRANVANYLRLLKLQPEICYMLGRGELGMGHARAVAGIADPARQLATARLAVRRNLSVRQVEELARRAPELEPAVQDDETRRGRDHHLEQVGSALGKALGLRVRLAPGRRKNSGRIIITYNSLEEFDRVAERLNGNSRLDGD